ncbi:MAG: choice-of-anchor Q domain-containing protein, partial [Planctomycetaceae bacterium]
VNGSFDSQGNNIIGNVAGATGFTPPLDIVGVNPDAVIDPLLRDNGGPTLTHRLVFGSVAIDFGDNAAVTLETDQRGSTRILDGDGDGDATVDLGAVEFGGFFVNSILDTVDADPGDGIAADSDGNTTLRAALMEANALAGGNTIVLPAGTFELNITGSAENAARSGDLDVIDTSGVLNVIGAGDELTTISAAALGDRLFHLIGTELTLLDVTISGGQAGAGQDGGAILNEGGVLTVQDSVIADSSAGNRGGAIFATDIVTPTISFVSANVAAAEGNPVPVIFGNAVNVSVGGQSPQKVLVGDFNNDGKQDLAVLKAGSSNTVSILIGNGDGTFGAPANVTVGSNPQD